MSRESLEKWQAKREEKKRKNREERAAARREHVSEVRSLMAQVRRAVRNSGLTQTQIARFTGVVKSAITRIMKTNHETARFDTIVRLLAATGHRIEIVPIDPHQDKYRHLRKLTPPPLED